MTGAMYASVAGLKAHMSALNVIGNNVANVNTEGYKSGRYIFQSALYTSLRGGSNGTDTIAGKNPSQTGFGANLGSVDIEMGTSTYSPTGKPMDSMIDGDGFYLIGGTKTMEFHNTEELKSLTLTRVGDFDFKADGYLANRNGDAVYGFQCMGYGDDGKTPVVSNELQAIHKPKITADGVVIYNETQYDQYKEYYKTQHPDVDENTIPSYAELKFAEMDSISIDEGTGKITGTVKDTDMIVTIGFIAIGNVENPNGVTQLTGTYYKCGEGAGDLSVSILGGAASSVIDYGKVGAGGTAGGTTGSAAATPTYDFENNYWKDTSSITDPGLTHIGGAGTDDAPAADGMLIHTGGTTGLLTSGLEQTNVDLATEISNMILIQRGYQANTRIITVTDSMLEELVNMKR